LDYWFEPPINRLLAGGLLGIAGLSFSLCIRRFILACRQAGGMASAQWFVRAIRWLLIALTALSSIGRLSLTSSTIASTIARETICVGGISTSAAMMMRSPIFIRLQPPAG
jgi:hypothetical protein